MIINSLANIYPKALLNYAKLLRVSPLTHNQTYGYFADDLMLRRIVESKPSIYLPASHLYLDSLINQKFNEKLFCMLLIELDKKMIEEQKNYHKMFEYAHRNLQFVTQFKTISLILTQAFAVKYQNPKIFEEIARRGFELLRVNRELIGDKRLKAHSYSKCKFMIAIDRLVGLHKFTDEDYNQLNILDMKPLFVIFILQLFWKRNLQDKLDFPKKLMNSLRQNEKLIPNSDLHHMISLRKTIKDNEFLEIYHRIKNGMNKGLAKHDQQDVDKNDKVVGHQQVQETKIRANVVALMYNQYIDDLRNKYL